MAKVTKKGWTMRLAYEGFNILFADYEKAIIDLMLADPLKAWGSSAMHKAVRAQGIDISRASVIFYMNFLVDEGIAGYETATGRGGHHRLYSIPRTEFEVKKRIMIKIVDGLGEALDVDLDWITERWIS
ncbi:hypothetical protein ES702_01842 [subsurface metagenome]